MTQRPETQLKYRWLAEELRRQIEGGELRPGDRLPSRAELHALYGVAQPTVDRAHVLLEQEGLIQRIQGRGTFVADRPLVAAPDAPIVLADSRTVVAIVQPDHSFFDRCVELLYRHTQAADLTLHFQVMDPKICTLLGPPPAAQRPLGFILFSYHLEPLAKQLHEAGCRVVLVGTPPIGVTPEVPCVYGDQEQGSYLLTRHLLDLGHRHIAFEYDTRALRWRGDQRAVREAQKKWGAKAVRWTAIQQQEIEEWTQHPELAAAYFRCPEAPTAVALWNDDYAMQLWGVLSRVGVQVPDEVSLVGYDNLPAGERFHPALTTVDPATDQQLQAALNLLTRPLSPSDKTVVPTVMVTPTLVCRESSAPPQEALSSPP